MNSRVLVLAALVPLMTGPLPSTARTLDVPLCNGGTLRLALGDQTPREPPQPPVKGCHAICQRKRGAYA